RLQPLECRDVLVHNALFTGDLDMVQKYFPKGSAVNLIIETRSHELRWTSKKFGGCAGLGRGERGRPGEGLGGIPGTVEEEALGRKGLWSQQWDGAGWGSRQRRGAVWGCAVGAAPRWEGPPTALSRPPRCARQLLQCGASANSRTEGQRDAALHGAARLGLAELVQLLLRSGAEPEARNAEGQTPLIAACAQPHAPRDAQRYRRVCQLLLQSGASVDAADRDLQRPLHLACRNASAQVAELLLAHGADVNAMNYSGNTALHGVLQAAACRLEHSPELVVRALLNRGAVRVWPGSLLKVLRCCHTCPRVIEALMNSYDRVRVSDEWVEAVPAEVVQKYPRFYQSLFSLEHTPRSLQHLARHALRTFLEGRLLQVLSQLHLPSALHQFLLLGFEDVLY
ncbi:ASB10 protein, partial [Centropus unirufus]|nr:ASB10 protein [Centropus unirufus]